MRITANRASDVLCILATRCWSLAKEIYFVDNNKLAGSNECELKQETQPLLGDRATRKHAKDS